MKIAVANRAEKTNLLHISKLLPENQFSKFSNAYNYLKKGDREGNVTLCGLKMFKKWFLISWITGCGFKLKFLSTKGGSEQAQYFGEN